MKIRNYKNILKAAIKPWKSSKYISRIMPDLVGQDQSIVLATCQASGITSFEIRYLEKYTILVDSSAGIIAKDIIKMGNFSLELCKLSSDKICRKNNIQDIIFVNIGANMGTTCLNVRHCGFKNFIAFEPVENNYRLLKYNLEFNIEKENFKIQKIALGRESGEAEIHLHNNNCGRHSLKREFNRLENISSTQVVKVQTLDAQNIKDECFIWLDTEGFELEVLEGASETLKNSIGLCIEISPSVYTASDLERLEEILTTNFRKFYNNNGEEMPKPSSSEHWAKRLQHDLICIK